MRTTENAPDARASVSPLELSTYTCRFQIGPSAGGGDSRETWVFHDSAMQKHARHRFELHYDVSRRTFRSVRTIKQECFYVAFRAHALSQREGKNEHSSSPKGHVDRATEKKLASVQMPLAGRPDHTLFDSRPFVKPPIPGGHS